MKLNKTTTKRGMEELRDKLITFEHGKVPKGSKFEQWACECWPDKRIKKLVNIFSHD